MTAISLNSEVQGENNDQEMLILHGLFGSISNWRSIARHFAKTYKVTSLDLRNHGKSSWADDMNYDAMSKDVASYIHANSVINPTIIGHSMGGKILMNLLQSGYVKIKRAFIIDIAPVKYDHDHSALLQGMNSVNLEAPKTRTEIESELAVSIGDPALRQYLMQNLVRKDEGYRWRINLQSINKSMPYLFDYNNNNCVEDKVIFIRGGQSDYILDRHHEAIFRKFPSAVIETVKDSGHWLHAEKPIEMIKIIENHI